MNRKYAILILSCDKYQDLWNPFFDLFWKHWPDCPYTVYLGSNYIPFYHKKVKNILTGKDINWSTSYRKLLRQIPEKYIFVLLEDGFFAKRIHTSFFSECFNFLENNQGNHLQPKLESNNSSVPKKMTYNEIKRYYPYRAHVIGFWKKDYLYKLLLDGESPWNFEIMGSYRTFYDDGFFSLSAPLLSYVHIVNKGRWIPNSVQYCIDNTIRIDISKRRKLTMYEIFLYTIKDHYFKLIYFHLDWRIRTGLMNILRKILLSY